MLVCPQLTKKITFVKLTGTIQRKIVGLIMIFLITCITTKKSDLVIRGVRELPSFPILPYLT